MQVLLQSQNRAVVHLCFLFFSYSHFKGFLIFFTDHSQINSSFKCVLSQAVLFLSKVHSDPRGRVRDFQVATLGWAQMATQEREGSSQGFPILVHSSSKRVGDFTL